MHPKNLHINGYDYDCLAAAYPDLSHFIRDNGHGRLSIDYAQKEAVYALNKAIILCHYGMKTWSLPDNALCPPIPGRADYILHIADLLANESNGGKIPRGQKCTILDVGIGASAIYPILGNALFDWSFIGSDINTNSLHHVEKQLMAGNEHLAKCLTIRLQKNATHIFEGIIEKGEFIDATICNPPFHTSAEDAERRTKRKWKQLGLDQKMESTKSFGGLSNELWCEGGEVAFIQKMIQESAQYSFQVLWFTTLVSRKTTLAFLDNTFAEVKPVKKCIIEMGQGQKSSRFIAWTFLDVKQHEAWAKFRF